MVDRPPQPADEDSTDAKQHRGAWKRVGDRLLARYKQHPRAWQGVGVGLFALGLLVLLLACVLWIPRWLYPALTDSDLKDVRTAENQPDAAKVQELKGARLKLQNDARTTMLQGLAALLVLTGAGIGAAVTLRQVKVSQDGLKVTREQLEDTREQMQRTSEATEQQLNLAEQSQVTDRYTKAVEQLGHEKAPVRLGALYSLEHLAQDNPQYRQTVVDVVCAYLRMPYTHPARSDPDATHAEQATTPAEDGIPPAHPVPGQDPAQEELQVRQTAQRLLGNHLRRPPQASGQDAQFLPPSPQQAFWPGISLDLTGATLVDFNFMRVSVIEARFVGTTFRDNATFFEATFQGGARFGQATFQSGARFTKARFQGGAWFSQATFQGDTGFAQARFQGGAWFPNATFKNVAGFDLATFHGNAWFGEAIFRGKALFTEVTFQGDAGFQKATFQGDVGFHKATLQGDAGFDRAHVLHLDNFDRRRMWPDGWTVLPDPTDPTRGTLVRAEDANEPEPAVPPSDSGSGTG
jgi:uncharacterized protein YjbI with pentapeptide repeats